jgi:hypothetical protein
MFIALWSDMTNQQVFRFDFEQGEELLNELNNGEGISIDLSRYIAQEMNQLRRDPDGILLVGTEGTKTVTIFLAPQHVVEGIAPVLIPTFDDQRIVAMVSKEFIEATAARHNEAEDQDLAQIEWNLLLDNLFEATVELANNR